MGILDEAIKDPIDTCQIYENGIREYELMHLAMHDFFLHSKLPTYWPILRMMRLYVSNMMSNGEHKKQKS